jgi:hypothetical protein
MIHSSATRRTFLSTMAPPCVADLLLLDLFAQERRARQGEPARNIPKKTTTRWPLASNELLAF